jgi:hypothetical protein
MASFTAEKPAEASSPVILLVSSQPERKEVEENKYFLRN